ncbi:MAG: hypothetical protein H0X01_09775 [Nitrospira sp.]|nr:hypothetical protein [Nitrospira sp.]
MSIDPARVNVMGGAISRGHPIGARALIEVTKQESEYRRFCDGRVKHFSPAGD